MTKNENGQYIVDVILSKALSDEIDHFASARNADGILEIIYKVVTGRKYAENVPHGISMREHQDSSSN